MSYFTKLEIERLGSLCSVSFSEEEYRTLANEMNNITDWLIELQSVNVDNIEPIYSIIDHELLLRDDKVDDTVSTETLLSNSPGEDAEFFTIQKLL